MIQEPHYLSKIVKEQIARANRLDRPLYLVIIGTKPCYIKLASLIHALDKDNTPFLAVDVGQHYDSVLTSAQHELSFSHLISVYLNVRGTLTQRSATLAQRVEWLYNCLTAELGLRMPAIPVVSGDTSSAGLLPVYWYLQTGIRSIHVEAGLRSAAPEVDWNLNPEEILQQQPAANWTVHPDAPFPEGFDTRLATLGSQLLLAPVVINRDHLLREGYAPDIISLSGSLSADALELTKKSPIEQSVFDVFPYLAEGEWLRVDVHRRENMRPDYLTALLEGLQMYCLAGGKTVLVLTNALKAALIEYELNGLLDKAKEAGMKVTEHWPQYRQVIEFLRTDHCAGVFTDSGGLQEETNMLGVKCATFRYNTDRPETIIDGRTNLLVPPVSNTFIAGALQALFLDKSVPLADAHSVHLYGSAVGEGIAKQLKGYTLSPPALSHIIHY